jgi:hypothetical protein
MINKKKFTLTAHDENEMADLEDDITEHLDGIVLHPGQKCRVIIEILDDDELMVDMIDDEDDEFDDEEAEDF